MGLPHIDCLLHDHMVNYEKAACHHRKASKSPDLAGDLPIFDKIMEISRFGLKISRFIIITKDSRLALSIASFAIGVSETISSLANFRKFAL